MVTSGLYFKDFPVAAVELIICKVHRYVLITHSPKGIYFGRHIAMAIIFRAQWENTKLSSSSCAEAKRS